MVITGRDSTNCIIVLCCIQSVQLWFVVKLVVDDDFQCPNLCETTTEHRLVICSSRDGRIQPDGSCDSQRRPESKRNCPMTTTCDVPVRWHAAQWSPVSK